MIDLTYGLRREQALQHGIRFGHFDSARFGLHLHARTSMTPHEKEAIASIPHMQGVVDMSHLLGHRVYENREITYIFYRFGVEKQPTHELYNAHSARDFHTTIENLLMQEFDQELHDSFEPDFYYTGKCKDVVVTDEYNLKRLRVELTFDLHPFKIDKHLESEDLFDSFNFDLDAFHNGLRFTVASGQPLRLYNTSLKVLLPEIQLISGSASLQNEGGRATLVSGAARRYPGFRLQKGMNDIQVTGNGVVQFDWRKERI